MSNKYKLPEKVKQECEEEYGNIVLEAVLNIEGGILVFFSSYQAMENYI